MKCPFVTDWKKIEKNFNKAILYKSRGNEDYIFFDHDDGFGKIKRVQFCDLIGRKKDVFECFNESEWKECYAYRSNIKREVK